MAIRQNGDRAPGTGTIEAAVTDAPAVERLSDVAAGATVVLSAPRTAGGGRVIKSGTSRYAIDRATLEMMDVLR